VQTVTVIIYLAVLTQSIVRLDGNCQNSRRLHAVSRAVINYLRTIYCRSDISPGNSLFIPQYTAILMFVSSVFCCLLEVNDDDDDDDDDVLMMIYSGSTDSEAWDQLPLSQVAEIAKTVPKWH